MYPIASTRSKALVLVVPFCPTLATGTRPTQLAERLNDPAAAQR